MFTLTHVLLLLLFATGVAWFWHGQGLRERALAAVQRHCEMQGVELLDGNVAFGRYRLVRDLAGKRRFARVYAFEFTVTGEQRHSGSITLFGARVGRIELAPYPFRPTAEDAAPVAGGRVIQLDDWRRRSER